jgi:hypothetical protein
LTPPASVTAFENVKAFFPAVREFVYNPNVKNALVLKAYDIISHRRLEFDAGHTDIRSHLWLSAVHHRQRQPPHLRSQPQRRSQPRRSGLATMHALFNEPLQGEAANTSNIVEIF